MKTKSRRAGWIRDGVHCGAKWTSAGGQWLVQHCGHPTALWPYYLVGPGGVMVIHSSGYTFRKLAEAQATAELLDAGQLVAVDFHHGYCKAVAPQVGAA